MKIDIMTEDGEIAQLCFSITENAADERRFGISADMYIGNDLVEHSSADDRFFTFEEAEKTVDMLCSYEVTPCTLCDVLPGQP